MPYPDAIPSLSFLKALKHRADPKIGTAGIVDTDNIRTATQRLRHHFRGNDQAMPANAAIGHMRSELLRLALFDKGPVDGDRAVQRGGDSLEGMVEPAEKTATPA
ncbi:hypothetical protein RsS62_60610 [Rhizobium dioscoreae]|nr:hypothetical protein RsS62_60610 [Rhizobium dioscoreae]